MGASIKTNGDVYIEQPFDCYHTIIPGSDNEIALVYCTKSNGCDRIVKDRVDNFNDYDEDLKAVYYLPEKYIIQYNMLDSKHMDFSPTPAELEDIKQSGTLLWKK